MSQPRDVLAAGVASLARLQQADGTLNDEVFACPTQYGTAYFGWCCAVLGRTNAVNADLYREWGQSALRAALAHTADPSAEPYASGFDRRTLSVTGRLNHRDFTWPPILKSFLALAADDTDLRRQISGVKVPAPFRARPPSNWAAVWMSGEWLRMQAGLSTTTPEQFDAWVDTFITVTDGVGFDLELGMYLERGLPNSYDLFTRAHFTDLLVSGYDGRHRGRLEAFLTTGLRRSLAMQLSDGSLASGYRSAGQTWVLGAQIALFTGSRRLGLGSAEDQEGARLGAWRAFDSLARWQRPGATFSPVQNLLAPQLRVGYETYTSDGHYSPLALGFLASAVQLGFGSEPAPAPVELDGRASQARAEGAPSHRGAAHAGRVSVAVQAEADDTYDATGLVDLTFGSGRWLHGVSAARHLSGGPWLVPGLALREWPGASAVVALCARPHRLLAPLAAQDRTISTDATVELEDGAQVRHTLSVTVTEDGAEVVEATPGRSGYVSLLVPYLRDVGTGQTTTVGFHPSGVRLTLGEEWLDFAFDGAIEGVANLPYGYESRRGLCGLVRVDLVAPTDELRWRVLSSPS